VRWLLICGGESSRWNNHLGRPKHLIRIAGEVVLERTVRQIHERDPDADVVVVVKDMDADYLIDGTRRTRAKLDPSRAQADKVLSSQHVWSSSERTMLLFGDVWWSNEAMDLAAGSTEPWCAFARFTRSEVTGCKHPELFGFAFNPEHRSKIADAANLCVELADSGELTRWSGGWQVYKAAAGAERDHIVGVRSPNYNTRDLGHSVEIDDWTDDFDAPADWDRWCWHYAQADVKPT
jgi:hypothetical protein